MKRLDPHSALFTLLLGSLVTLASFATDMGLPVLAETAASLHTTPATAALSLSVFMVGFAFGPLVMAPASDHFGRKPLLLVGCATFALFGALGAFAQSLGALLLWRVLMGVGAGTAQVVVLATVRDLFRGAEARARQSYVNLAAGLAPIIAPTLGVWIAAAGGWRAIYASLAIGGMLLFALVAMQFAETARHAAGRAALSVRGTLGSYARAMRHPVTMGYALVIALGFGALFAFVSGSSLVLIGVMGVTRRVYGALFALTSLGLVAGAFVNARLNRRGVSHRKLIFAGLCVVATITLVLLLLSVSGLLRPWLLVGLIVVSNFAHAIVRANAAQGALEPMSDIAGVAGALMTGLQMIAGASASATAASLFDGRTAIAMTGTMVVCAVGALAVYVAVVRPAEQRLGRPGPVTDEVAVAALSEAAL